MRAIFLALATTGTLAACGGDTTRGPVSGVAAEGMSDEAVKQMVEIASCGSKQKIADFEINTREDGKRVFTGNCV